VHQIHQGALPGAEEEHAAAQDAVCAVQSVDGAPPIAGGAGMSAPENRQGAAKAVQAPRNGAAKQGSSAAKTASIASSENIGLVALTNPSYSGHP